MRDDPAVAVDFNERDAGGHVVALAEALPSDARVGLAVRLQDSEGNSARGVVESIGHDLASIRIDWSAWAPAGSEGGT